MYGFLNLSIEIKKVKDKSLLPFRNFHFPKKPNITKNTKIPGRILPKLDMLSISSKSNSTTVLFQNNMLHKSKLSKKIRFYRERMFFPCIIQDFMLSCPPSKYIPPSQCCACCKYFKGKMLIFNKTQ